jgi:hypothetical protein
MSYPLYGNVIVDSSNNNALGGTLIISNSCNTHAVGNQASIAFGVADISYGILNQGLYSGGLDNADVRITAIIDTLNPTGSALSFNISPNTANPPVEALRISSSGNITTPYTISALNVNVKSDYRLKNNVQPLDVTKTIQLLRPVEYDISGGKHDMGFLAHEVQEVFPFLVNGYKDGLEFQTLNYTGFIALLVKELKEVKESLSVPTQITETMYRDIQTLTNTVEQQQTIISNLEARISLLENK